MQVKFCPECGAEVKLPVHRDMMVCTGDPMHLWTGMGFHKGMAPVEIEQHFLKEIIDAPV